ncbi:MAG: BolA/IbaG family iron-sulfur metabolism protein [Kofleriaceae bacterium]|nr:BolA/IbaG family iron-sulfur metabolism protein [Myxococcales bacterium]MCB9558856.1 BolA/IbaG family iron-sulfur metabolism protein [Kofleriaceae bacterium]MCB9570587.1 BolA/IbaG family iron-sulfur metabolism protein [Kofleriaceae bacterium]
MSVHLTTYSGDINDAIRTAITAKLPDAVVEVGGGGGHWTLVVTSAAFAGQSMLASHRLVMAAIAHLMAGDGAPVHAVDKLTTRTP